MIIVCHNVTSDDAVELRFENETIVVYKDDNCDLSGQEMQSYRTLDGRNIRCYGEHCNKISQFTWLKLFRKHEVEIVPCKIKNGKVFY